MGILTLDECLSNELMTKRVYNRLKRIEHKLGLNGAAESLPIFLFSHYIQGQMTLQDIAMTLLELTQMTTSHGRLREYMSAMGIPILSRSEAVSGARNPNYGNRGEENPLTGRHIAEELRKRLSDARKGEGNPFYGKTHTHENREKMASATKGKTWEEICGQEQASRRKEELRNRQSGRNCQFFGRKGTCSPTFGRSSPIVLSSSHGGYRRDLGHFVRSTWEANVARVFLVKGERYVYEPQRFVLNIDEEYRHLFPGADKTTYLPDFKNGHYYEVKGSFDMKGGDQSLAKMLMFMEQHGLELELIGSQEYAILERAFAPIINRDKRFCGWETSRDNVKTNPAKYS